MFAAGCMYFVGFQCIALRACGFFFLLHHILLGIFLCAKLYAVRKKYHFTLDFVAKIEKKRYNDIILNYALANMQCNLTIKGCTERNHFCLRAPKIGLVGGIYEA